MRQLHDVTSIEASLLSRTERDRPDLSRFSIAMRMSWVSRRQTTRPEDIAYCLFGIFGVQLPPLYGEGEERAFLRLQEEIIGHSTDLSILAWSTNHLKEDRYPEPFKGLGALAESPSWFAHSGHIVHDGTAARAFELTNRGLRVELPVSEVNRLTTKLQSCAVILTDCFSNRTFRRPISILLCFRIGSDDRATSFRWNGYASTRCGIVSPNTVSANIFQRAKLRDFYIATNPMHSIHLLPRYLSKPKTRPYVCTFDMQYQGDLPPEMKDRVFLNVPPVGRWDVENRLLELAHAYAVDNFSDDLPQAKIHAMLRYRHGVNTEPIAMIAIYPRPGPGRVERFGLFRPRTRPNRDWKGGPTNLRFSLDGIGHIDLGLSMTPNHESSRIETDYVLSFNASGEFATARDVATKSSSLTST